jgi:hypothetical protein
MNIRKTILAIALGAIALTPSIAAAQEREMPTGAMPLIGNAARDCDFSADSYTPSAAFTPDPDIFLTISNGSSPKNVIIQYSAEAAVSAAGGRLDLRWSIDGAAPIITGPEFYTGDTAFSTRTHMSVVTIPGGTHTVRPFFRYQGPAGSSGTIFFRCATLEGRTK